MTSFSGKALQFSRKEIKEIWYILSTFPVLEGLLKDAWVDHKINGICHTFSPSLTMDK